MAVRDRAQFDLHYKGKAVDVRQVGRDLAFATCWRAACAGGKRLRITGQLVEAETGAHIWADRYDGALEDVFDMQDKITPRSSAFSNPTSARRNRARAPQASGQSRRYDLYLRALPHFASVMPEDAKIAWDSRTGLKLDPTMRRPMPISHVHGN